eukprot:gene20025-26001_t
MLSYVNNSNERTTRNTKSIGCLNWAKCSVKKKVTPKTENSPDSSSVVVEFDGKTFVVFAEDYKTKDLPIERSATFPVNAVYFAPSPLDPVLWTEPFELPQLIGPVKPNKILQNHIKLGESQILAPESLAFDEESGDGFASLSDGRIVKLNKNGDYIRDISFKGSINNDKDLLSLKEWCHTEALAHRLAWNNDGERNCGRPLGLRFLKILLDKAPGVLDNIRYVNSKDKKSTYLIGVGAKSTKPFSLLWLGYQSNLLRHLIGRLIPMKLVEHLVPKYGMVLYINDQGKIITSLQDPNGTIALISEAQRNPKTGDLWMGSHSNPYMAIIRNNQDLDKNKRLIAFFHPFCNSGGGGERVLWKMIECLLLNKDLNLRYDITIYSGELSTSKYDILANVKCKFNIDLEAYHDNINICTIKSRFLLQSKWYPIATLICQSIASTIVGMECLLRFSPDIYIDTTGEAFIYPLAVLLGGCTVIPYVHYPTISTDMLNKIIEQRPSYNNNNIISSSRRITYLKQIYYRIFQQLYTFV